MISSNIKRSLLMIAAFSLLVLATGFDQPPHQILDEDDMVSDSAVDAASQQSLKAFVTSGTITMSGKTLTSPVLNTGISGTAFLDEDDMVSDSPTKVASQQSIKKYVDDNAAATKEFIVLPNRTGPDNTLGDWAYSGSGMSSEAIFFFVMPADFTSLTSAVVVCIPDATETVTWDNDASVAAVGEDYNADTRQSLNETKEVTANDLTELDVSVTLTGLAALDYVSLRFQSDIDTIPVLGLKIKYN